MVDELLVELEFVGASLRGKDVEDGVGGARGLHVTLQSLCDPSELATASRHLAGPKK